jgi:hypothetical protein
MTPDLHDVVRELTEPTYEHVFQKSEGGDGVTVTVEMPGLLEQMRQAVMPSSNSDAGSASAKHTRSIADLDAMYEYAKMTAQIGSWCQMVRIRVTRDAVVDLVAWHDKARSVFAPEQLDWYRRTLTGWANQIRNHLEPPEAFTPHVACPVCGATGYGNAIDGGGSWPIEIRYRLDANETMTDEVARCRATCKTVWYGHDAIVELADECNEKQLTTVSTGREDER